MKRRYITPPSTVRKRRRSRTSSSSSYLGGVARAGLVAGGAAAGAYGAYRTAAAVSTAVGTAASMVGAEAGLAEAGEVLAYMGAGPALDLIGAAAAGPVAIGGAIGLAVYEGARAISNAFTEKTNSQPVIRHMNSYGGRFILGKKAKKTLRDKFQAYGAVSITETNGTVTDNEMIAIGHSTFALTAACEAIGLALLRKLFRKAGYDVSTPNSELELLYSSQSGPNAYIIVFSVMDADGTVAEATTTIPDNKTLLQCYEDKLKNYIYNSFTQQNPEVLQCVTLYSLDGNGQNNRLTAQINMKREVLNIRMMSQMTIHNRSVNGGQTSALTTDDFDALALKGPVMQFNGIPKTKQPYVSILNTDNISGVIIARASGLVGSNTQDYKEPPTRTQFNNVTKSAYCRFAPGAIHEISMVSNHRAYFNNFLAGSARVITENNRVAYAPGKCQVIFLEEEINVGTTRSIHVNYECQHTIGAELITTKAPSMLPTFAQVAYSEIEPVA